MSEIKKSGDSQSVRALVGDPGKTQDSVLSEAVSLGMKKVRTLFTQRSFCGFFCGGREVDNLGILL